VESPSDEAVTAQKKLLESVRAREEKIQRMEGKLKDTVDMPAETSNHFKDLQDLVFQQYVGYMVAEKNDNPKAVVKSVSTPVEGRDNIAYLDVWDSESKTQITSDVFKSEGENGRKGVFNSSPSAAGLIAEAITLPVAREKIFLGPDHDSPRVDKKSKEGKQEDAVSLGA